MGEAKIDHAVTMALSSTNLADFIQTVTTAEQKPGLIAIIIGATLIAVIGLSWYWIERTRKP